MGKRGREYNSARQWAAMPSLTPLLIMMQQGLFNPKTGGDYRKHILGSGGAIDAMDFLTAFLGRAPNDAAFLESKGLTDKSSASGADAGAGAGAATDDAQ